MINKPLRPLPMLHLLMLSPGRIASTQILDIIFAGLADQGALFYRALYDNEAYFSEQKEAIRESDIVFLFRSYTLGSLSLLRFAKELGKIVIYSTDDDFRALDPTTPLGRIHHHPENVSAYETLFREADLIWLFTQEMRQRYNSLNNRVVIGRLPSFVEFNHPDLHAPFEVDEAQHCVIGYGGSRHHHADWQLLVRPLLQVLDSYTHVCAEFVNYAPEELSRHPKARVLPLLEDLRAYYEFLRHAHWTIGLAPLVDTSFNRGRTNNKYREYAGLGIPGIYSDMPVYSSCIRHGETGYLTPHSERGFHEALRIMIESPSLRSTICRCALQDASSTYSLKGVQLQFLQEVSLLAIRKQYKKWRKPTLLMVGSDKSSSMHIGALQPSRRLAQQDLLQFSWVQPADLTQKHLDGINAVYVVRAFQPELFPLLDWARARRVPVISSWDDDFLSIPSGTPLGNYYHHPAIIGAIKRFLTESSFIIASTGPLVTRSREFSDRVMESLYGLDIAGLSAGTDQVWPPTSADGKIRIGFYGANAGIHEPWLIEALRKLRGRYGTRIVLEIIGEPPPRDLQEVVDWFSDNLPYEESLELLRSRGWDIGLAPLANTTFNAAKQATKFRDYAWTGAAIVCSKVPAYERMLMHGIHCLLVENTAIAWEEAIASLIDDLSKANFLKQGAKQLLEAVHTQEITNATWLQLIWRIGVTEAQESLAETHPTIVRNDEIIESIGSPPLAHARLDRILRYRLTPRLPRWKGVEVLCCTSFEETRGRLGFQIRLKNGCVIRDGEVALQARNKTSWIRLEFPPIHHADRQSFVLELRLLETQATQVGLFEMQPSRSVIRRMARRLRVFPVRDNLFSQLVYAR